MGSFSIWHWLIVLVIVLVIFGTKKLKNVGSDLGSAVKGFKDALDVGYVRIKFTNTKGNTELGLRVDQEACDLAEANFDEGTGKVRIVGNLSVDYTRVRCVANIDLTTLDGVGHLEKVEAAAIG